MYITGFLIGLLGSVHCLGMCGPIALAMHTQSGYKSVIYNVGRVISYTSIGVVLGVVGSGASLFGMQQYLSIIAGIVVLMITFSPKLQSLSIVIPWQKNILNPLRKVLSSTRSKKSMVYYLTAGILNGLLPCGLVYMAVSASIVAGSIYDSMTTMIGFGLGTWPMMLGIGWGSLFMKNKIRSQFKYVIPVFSVLMGGILILRGMGMDIQYLSPLLTFVNFDPEITVCD